MRSTYRPSPAVVEARKREIARRYGAQAKRKLGNQPLTLAAVRISELTRLFDHRYGTVLLPDSDDGVTAAKVMVHHLARLKDAPRRISDWLGTCTPWLGLASRERLIRDGAERPLRWSADRLAWKLRVTAAERVALNLRTIGAMDMTREQRAEQAKQRRSERQRTRRRARGVKPRSEYEGQSLTRSKPWAAAGVSRAKWYRQRKAEAPRETSP